MCVAGAGYMLGIEWVQYIFNGFIELLDFSFSLFLPIDRACAALDTAPAQQNVFDLLTSSQALSIYIL